MLITTTSRRTVRLAGLGAVALGFAAAAVMPAGAGSASVAGDDSPHAAARHAYALAADEPGRVKLDLLAINDFHGNFVPRPVRAAWSAPQRLAVLPTCPPS